MSKWSSAYRDSRWQKLRLKIMERDNFTCRSCGKSEGVTLNVHHAYYEAGKAPWEYDNDVLITYCEECHAKRHKAQKDLLGFISKMSFDHFMLTVIAGLHKEEFCARIAWMITHGMLSIESLSNYLNSIEHAYKSGREVVK